jgi:hypothetical protein
MHLDFTDALSFCNGIRVITKLLNTEQSSKGKGKTHKSTNRQNQSTTGKLGKPQWHWLGTGISKEMVGWIRFYCTKPPASIMVKRFRLSLYQHFKQYCNNLVIIVVNAVLYMKIHRLLSSLQNGLTKQSYTIWFQMRCWMTSCLNHDYLILIFIHFPYLLYENPSFIIVSAERIFFDKILVSEYKLFKRSNKANLLIALVQ